MSQEPSNTAAPHAEQASRLLAVMARALEGTRLLGADHPATRRACEDAAGAECAAGAFAVLPDAIALGDAPLPNQALFRVLHARLRELDAAVLMVRPPLTAEVVLAGVGALAGHGSAVEVLEAFRAAAGEALRVIPIDYSRLTTGGEGAGATLSALIQSMLTGDAPARDRAGVIESRYAAGDEGMFAAEFARAAAGIEALPPEQQPAAFANLRPLIATLGTRFREQLLSPGNADAHIWRVLATVSDAIPAQDIHRALRSLNETPAQLSVEAAAVFAKLASTLPADSPEAPTARAVRDVACEVLCADDANLSQRLETVLRVRSGNDFSPADYRARIVTLASSSVSPGTASPLAGAFDAPVLEQSLCHAVASVASLRPEKAGVVERLVERAKTVLEQEGPGLFVEVGARADAPASLRALLLDGEFLGAALAHGACTPELRARLLGACGPAQLPALLALVVASPTKVNRAAACDLLAAISDDEVGPALQGLRDAASAPRALAALTLVPSLARARALALCRVLRTHAEGAIRAESLRVHAGLEALAPGAMDAALRDSDDAVAAQALQLLLQTQEGSVSVAGALAAWGVPDARFDMLAGALMARGHEGIGAVAGVFTTLASSTDRAKAALADRLAAHLRAHKDHPAAAGALRRYRLSMSRLISLFFPEGGAAKASTTRSTRKAA